MISRPRPTFRRGASSTPATSCIEETAAGVECARAHRSKPSDPAHARARADDCARRQQRGHAPVRACARRLRLQSRRRADARCALRSPRHRLRAHQRQSHPERCWRTACLARTSRRSASCPSPIPRRRTTRPRPPASTSPPAAACKAQGLAAISGQCALERLAARCDVIHVDFDIDVVERARNARRAGRPARRRRRAGFLRRDAPHLRAPERSAASISPNSIPPLDVAAISALTAARWVCEVLAGFQKR
jgi:hypothetical protein